VIDTSTFGEFLFAAVLIILLPGPSVLFTIGRALAYGRKAAVLTVTGNTCGGLLIAVVVAAGVGPLVQSSKALLQTVQIAGALYLVWLAYKRGGVTRMFRRWQSPGLIPETVGMCEKAS
jgi:threonine/homoserine/homoserine lactone efflux protein